MPKRITTVAHSAPSPIAPVIGTPPGAADRTQAARLPETGFLRQPQVLTLVPISRSTLWRRVQAGTFPLPVKLSSRVTAWRAEDVRRWIAQFSG